MTELNKSDFTLIALDPRGYGQSRPPGRTWPLTYLQRDAEDAIELCKVTNYLLRPWWTVIISLVHKTDRLSPLYTKQIDDLMSALCKICLLHEI